MIDSPEYINKWIDLSVTLSEWLENNKIDHWKFIEQSDLDEKSIGEIENHQFLLFNKCVANVVQNKIERLNNKDDLVKKYLIFEELRLINLIISSTEFNPVLIELIKPIVSIKEIDYAEFLKEWHNVIAGEYTSFRKDFNIYRKGLSIKTPYFQANVVFSYKEELNRMIKNVFPPRTEINKREKVISKYLDAVERTLTMFLANREPSFEDIGTITRKTNDFTNALRELYFSDTQNKDEQYELIYNIISSARFQISKENFSTNPTGTYWGVIIYQLEIADKHITELHFKETNNFYPFPISIEQNIPSTRTEKLREELGKYGFFELPKVKQLSEPNKQRLIELISTNDLPYIIAMFEYLGFLKYLKTEHFTTDYKLFKEVADWFKVADRAVKGNIYVLNENSKENRTRYTADQQKQKVQNDYEKLK